jgi:hypothetical protein
MWRCVDPGLTNVSEERIAFIFRLEKSASGEPAAAGGCRLSYQSETSSYIKTVRECKPHKKFTLKMEVICSSETSVNPGSTRRHIPEDYILHSHRCENLNSYMLILLLHLLLWNLDLDSTYFRYAKILTKFIWSMNYVVYRNWSEPEGTDHGSLFKFTDKWARYSSIYVSNFVLTCYVINGLLVSC